VQAATPGASSSGYAGGIAGATYTYCGRSLLLNGWATPLKQDANLDSISHHYMQLL
jgi:hypothetical protein